MSGHNLALAAGAASDDAVCRNCNAPLAIAAEQSTANFCANCGQDTHNLPPTFWEFVHEFITHYVALEGKLWKTLVLLFFKPAELTREYRAGRKLRYISPLRLYITASFLFFLVVKIAGLGDINSWKPTADDHVAAIAALEKTKAEVSASFDVKSSPQLAEAEAEAKAKTIAKLDAAIAKAKLNAEQEKFSIGVSSDKTKRSKREAEAKADSDEAIVDAARETGGAAKLNSELDSAKGGAHVGLPCKPNQAACLWLKNRLQKKYEGRPGIDVLRDIGASMISNIPYALFMLLPLFALMTKVLFVRRGLYFGEHVVYALHIHAFTFFALLLVALLPDAAQVPMMVAAFVYYIIAIQRFFGGRWWMNVLRYAAIGFLYPMLLSVVTMFLLLFVIVA